MLLKAPDENDGSFDAYFGWLSNSEMNLRQRGSGGGNGWYKFRNGNYYNSYGKKVSFEEVLNNYIIPNSEYTIFFKEFNGPSNTSFQVIGSDTRKLPTYGLFELEIRIKGDYKIFNVIQSLEKEGGWVLDYTDQGDHGFYYSRSSYNYWERPYYTRNYDFYFEDNPNVQTHFQTTFVGRKEKWEPIITFSWDWSINSEDKIIFNFSISQPNQYHFENINNVLNYWNHHEF